MLLSSQARGVNPYPEGRWSEMYARQCSLMATLAEIGGSLMRIDTWLTVHGCDLALAPCFPRVVGAGSWGAESGPPELRFCWSTYAEIPGRCSSDLNLPADVYGACLDAKFFF